LWVEVPGFEHNRINTAYFLGETYRLPGGGPGLAMQTVENLIGVPVPYYAVIEFSAFERFIDEIGGIEILVPERMKISPLGRDSYWLDAKSYLMDGPEALAYARARKTAGGDFDRAERQQQVLMAVRDQVLELDMVATLLGRAPALYQDLRQGIQTNLTLDQLVALGLLAAQVDLQDISKGVIAPPEMVLLDTHLDGAMVLKPVPDQIRALRDEIFTGTGAIAPSVPPETSTEAVQIEFARLAVLNGAGLEGLATDTAEYLQGQGLNVIQIDNADRIDYDKSRVIVYSQNYPYTIRYLAELLGLTEGQILQAVFPENDLDLMVILGADWAYGTRPSP
jgi:LCP family protein required for cell wall assembly